MIFQQLDKALAHHASRAQNAYRSFFILKGHFEILQHGVVEARAAQAVQSRFFGISPFSAIIAFLNWRIHR